MRETTLSMAWVTKTMNTSEHWLLLSLLLCLIPLGCCEDATFSICWMGKAGALKRVSGNLWLNDTSVKSIGRVGKVTSLTVSPGVENKLTFGQGSTFEAWTFQITLRTKFTKIKGRKEPVRQPLKTTEDLLNTMTQEEPFACENGTLFFHQDPDFFLAFGYTMRHPIQLEARSSSVLLVAWRKIPNSVSRRNRVTLHHIDNESFRVFDTFTTTFNNYRFRSLRPCSLYAACVEIVRTEAYICISVMTEPDLPSDIKVTSWNGSTMLLTWGPPDSGKYSSFFLTVFHLNGTDHVTEEVSLWKNKTDFEFVLSDLEPCSRVRFGLQSMCEDGTQAVYSKMALNPGTSEYSSIVALQQKSFGPDSYTLSWEVKDTSSISVFRVHHEGVLQGTTLLTNYTVRPLLPCKGYEAKVEALCGDSVLMSAQTISTHTGPRGVSDLRFRSNDSTAVWTPSTTDQPDLAFLYALSLQNGTTIESNRLALNHTELELSMLEGGQSYILDVWEQCEGQWESEHSHVFFHQNHTSVVLVSRTAGRDLDLDMLTNFSSLGLTIVVPWLLPKDLLENASEAKETIEKIFQDKLQELLEDFEKTVKIQLVAFQPVEKMNHTKVLFMSFDSSEPDEDLPLPVGDQLDHIRTLKAANVTVRDEVIFWDGPDFCNSSQEMLCPENSVCINTLDSYTCVCQLGYYDISSVFKGAATPMCNEKGLFSQCNDKLVTGGIAKPYLTSYMGGNVDVELNDGQCDVDEREMLFYFHTAKKSSECGTERLVNSSHIEFQNTMTVKRAGVKRVNRRDLKIVWKCVYPRHYVRNAQVSVIMNWQSALSLVQLSSSLHLGLTLGLYMDVGYTKAYKHAIFLEPENTLFFQVDLNSSFSADLLLRVESCWATENDDPQDAVQGLLLQDGCPVDNTFQWHSVNGQSQKSRFSVQMFNMPQMLPLFVHCLTTICGPEEDCIKNCTNSQRVKRAVSLVNRKEKQSAVVSAGPVMVSMTVKTQVPASHWAEHMAVISVVGGAIGFLAVTALSVSATKAIMTYYERRRQQ